MPRARGQALSVACSIAALQSAQVDLSEVGHQTIPHIIPKGGPALTPDEAWIQEQFARAVLSARFLEEHHLWKAGPVRVKALEELSIERARGRFQSLTHCEADPRTRAPPEGYRTI